MATSVARFRCWNDDESSARAAAGPRVPDKSKEGSESKSKTPDLAEFLEKRDWSGAITLLEYKRQGSSHDVSNLEWLAYCYFHAGDPGKALETYRDLLRLESDPDPTCHTLCAACLFLPRALPRGGGGGATRPEYQTTDSRFVPLRT